MNITKQKFESAQKVVNEYIQQSNQILISDFTCVCCKNTIIKHVFKIHSVDATEQENLSWDSGAVAKISCGYGSTLDGEQFLIGICDECLLSLLHNKLAVNLKEIRKKQREIGL
jgi:phage terminase large subunit-like protein